ncbi:carbon-nitrogen hydrolase family protein [Caminibacter pacificus]|uniref:Amidohydrolase n=1 Tax=Caminibacter pacificus TaxID=1424653 RepID=A0AAJ4UX05_9BACT|nr:carbon-nitrogen hydrolase family protein [Caminibacter pacificus]NPA88315.1 carbon-nitrogen hydrolase family protein [Campylobacterota bacterium]QCI29153.1 carbon-nitrogen hydrolase family protein [Caminibacter pacificus]ROR38796.1 putative amidohydrolase [Caminibacter pacificus]
MKKIELVNFKTSKDYEYNLKRVINIIKNSPADFLLFPEVCLTGFDYENWDNVNRFAKTAIQELSSLKKAFALTLINNNKNYFCLFDNGLKYKRAKYNLFGNEKEYFEIGEKPEIFEWRGLKIASLICFELRFIEYWEKFRGVDMILVPARWGKERMPHFKTLNNALALSTQSQVIAVNSANEFSWGCSFDAWGDGVEVSVESVLVEVDFNKNKKIRKKLNIGIQ